MKEFDRIIGYTAEKKELEQIADCLRNSEVYKNLGVSAPCGLLLYGEPGVGKTLMSDCLIKASGRKAFVCRKNKPNGEFVNEITKTFEQAQKNAPSIVFLDDMDKFANEDDRHPDAEEYVTVQSCIDNIKGKDVFVLATANDVYRLPRSLRREGRFDRLLEIGAPKGADAAAIISHYLEGKSLADDIDREYISRLMEGDSCARLETLINEAGVYAGYDRADKITMQHFMRAYLRSEYGADYNDDCDDCNSSSINISDTVWHEAGHTVVSEVLYPGSVTLVSVSGIGPGKNGFTSYKNINNILPIEYGKIRAVGALAGSAAIEQKLGVPGCGASIDYSQAFRTVRRLVENDCICGFHLHESPTNDSEALLSSIEQATAAKIEEYYRKAKEILALNSDLLEKIASALAEKKLLTAPEIQEIKNGCAVVSVGL